MCRLPSAIIASTVDARIVNFPAALAHLNHFIQALSSVSRFFISTFLGSNLVGHIIETNSLEVHLCGGECVNSSLGTVGKISPS